MNPTTEIFGDCMVVHAPQDLGREQADRFENWLRTVERVQMVLDIDNVEQIDSAGLTALVNVQEQLRALGGDLKISVASAVNRKIMEITRLDQQLEVFDSVIDAVKSFR
ncbi:MAG: STAS domain-containing protein [Planctomycetales bacterium]|nr:STAS domain-containing protein [Planctomycetales bacterium]MBN8626122.1 STAS domain-containing protein [Planctomycetota bacterium]